MEILNTRYDSFNEKKYTSILWVGITLYSIHMLISASVVYEIPILRRLFQYSGIVLIIYSLFRLLKRKNITSHYLFYTSCLLFIWHLYVAIKDFQLDSTTIFGYFHPLLAFSFVVPLFVFLPIKAHIIAFLKFTKFSNIVFFILLIIFPIPFQYHINTYIQYFCGIFAIGAAFMFMNNQDFSLKKNIYSLIITFTTFLLVTIAARRNLMLTFGLYGIIGLSSYFLSKHRIPNIEKKLIVILTIILSIPLGWLYFQYQKDNTFSLITDRVADNNREEVFLYFFSDMTNQDFIIGKGIYGTYFAPGIDGEILDDTYDERGFIECGYLQIILKGGLINLILLLAIFIPAIFKGYKSSNNTFSKVAASIIAVYLIDLLPFGLPVFDPKYIMVWMCVSICYNKDIRKMSNEEIRELLISQ